ncbi:hypothetical protein CYMTET_9532 [Cymbomonas tetramitiformis]|uniref:Uncharacterized protein n=1 Tax=Cymbomonas tetramitiformis TaxID=36881 RepID=A0AAE0GQU8_9CHLO|nr:hypothetical protein CYMTET_9532 [Cymbomonas tetramitiformis]
MQASEMPKCVAPIQTELLYGCEKDLAMADRICCHNTYWAEPSGYLRKPHVKLFQKLDSSAVTTFYDSTCNLPLFQAPVGRTFSDWKTESLAHGWPSFRPEETFKKNVVILPGGEVRSACGLHLGHDIPDHKGPRYCIDLVCIAGNGGDLVVTNTTDDTALEKLQPLAILPESTQSPEETDTSLSQLKTLGEFAVTVFASVAMASSIIFIITGVVHRCYRYHVNMEDTEELGDSLSAEEEDGDRDETYELQPLTQDDRES